MFHDQKGFTLVEVLVASVIMFSALVLGTLAYRTSINAMERVTANVLIADSLPAIMAEIKTGLMAQADHGDGHYGETITYSWRSKEIKSARNISSSYNEFTGGLDYGRFQLILSDIHLTVTCAGDGRGKKAGYDYRELSWLPRPD